LVLADFLNRLKNVNGSGGQYSARCPAHDDNRNSLSVSVGKDNRIICHCHAGCAPEDITAALGLTMRDLFAELAPGEVFPTYNGPQSSGKRPEPVAVYTYPTGAQKLKYQDKRFTWRHPDGAGGAGGWIWNRKGVPRSLYVAGALKSPVFVVEGEKDADSLHALGYNAVSGEDGAGPGKWRKEYTEQLKGLVCVVLHDNDDIGRAYGEETAAALHGAGCTVYALDLSNVWPEIPEHGDVSDMIAAFGPEATAGKLTALMGKAEEYKPPDKAGEADAVTMSVIKARNLQDADLPPAVYIVRELLTAGLAALVSPPKYGKSWYVLQLCLAVAAGMPFMTYRTERGACLYLALEDTPRRLQDRMNKLLDGKQAPELLDFAVSAKSLDDGLIEQLEGYVKSNPAAKLIVIDTLQKVRGAAKSNEGAYQADYRTMTPLKEFADRHNLCILVVHHLRKMKDEGDPFNMISGTNGILGALDTAIVMTREKRESKDTLMSVTGRDVEAQDKMIFFDRATCTWNMRGDADILAEQRAREEYDNSPIVKTIKGLLKQSPGGRWEGTAKDLLEAGKYIARSYLADSAQALGYKLRALDKPLYEYDKILYTKSKHGTGGQKHNFYYETIPESAFAEIGDAEQDELPFPA